MHQVAYLRLRQDSMQEVFIREHFLEAGRQSVAIGPKCLPGFQKTIGNLSKGVPHKTSPPYATRILKPIQ